MTKHNAVYQAWTAHDSWSGPEAAAGSLHLDEADRKAFIAAYWACMPKQTPEYYLAPEGRAQMVEVNVRTYARLLRERPGFRAAISTKIRVSAL